MNPTTDPVLSHPPAQPPAPDAAAAASHATDSAGDPILSAGIMHADTTATERKDARPDFATARTRSPFAIALAVAVLFDAFLVRMVLVPALLYLMGEKAWWLPGWLDRILPVIDVEGDARAQHGASGQRGGHAVTSGVGWGRERSSGRDGSDQWSQIPS